jgi:capsular polysaccharide biosynthesis protein
MQSYDLLKKCLRKYPELSVLAISDDFGKIFEDHTGPLSCIARHFPRDNFQSSVFNYRQASTADDVIASLAHMTGQTPRPCFDLVYIDHDHRFHIIAEQINASLALTHPNTVYVFDDAVPPEIGMAGHTRSQAWWVGEVWMLSKLLDKPSGEISKTILTLPPTGMLLAGGVSYVNVSETDTQYRELSEVSEMEELMRHLQPLQSTDPSASIEDFLSKSFEDHLIPISVSCDSRNAAESLIVDAPRQWQRRPPEFALDLSGRNLDTNSFYVTNRRIHSKCVDTFLNAYLTGFDSVVTEGVFHSRSIIKAENVAKRLVADSAYSRTSLKLHRGRLVLPKSATYDAVHVDAPIFFGTPDEPDNWGMWLLYGVPGANFFLNNREKFHGYLTCLRRPWQRDLLLSLGLVDSDLLVHSLEKTYFCSSVTLIRHDIRDLTISADDVRIFQQVAEQLSARSETEYGERIFISRVNKNGKTQAYRSLINEEELIEKLAPLGFTILTPQELDFPEQVRAFANAKIIVGLGGAGLFNAVFAKPDTLIITIESSAEFVDSHFNLFASCGLRCGIILGEQDVSDPRPIQKRWSLNVSAACRQIRDCL